MRTAKGTACKLSRPPRPSRPQAEQLRESSGTCRPTTETSCWIGGAFRKCTLGTARVHVAGGR